MASLRNRNGKWQVQIRRQGYSPLHKTFTLYKAATRWARQMESTLERGGLGAKTPLEKPVALALIVYRAL